MKEKNFQHLILYPTEMSSRKWSKIKTFSGKRNPPREFAAKKSAIKEMVKGVFQLMGYDVREELGNSEMKGEHK